MLNLFRVHYKAWRAAVSEYADLDMAAGKVELTKLFYGATPCAEVPFLLKLCVEIREAVNRMSRQKCFENVARQGCRGGEHLHQCTCIVSVVASPCIPTAGWS